MSHPNYTKEVLTNANSSLKNDESDVILPENKDAESINRCENSQSAIPPTSRKQRIRVTKESPKLVTPEERDWMEFINTHQLSEIHLKPPETELTIDSTRTSIKS